MPSALVLGATGFLGRAIAAALVTSGWKVRGVAKGAGAAPDGVEQFRLDVQGPGIVEKILDDRPADAVVLAAMDWSSPEVQAKTSVVLAVRVLNHLRDSGARVLVLGSSGEYAFQPERAVTEDDPIRPVTPYTMLKTCEVSSALAFADRVDVRVLRPFNPIGAGMAPRLAPAAFARGIARIAAGLEPPVLPVGDLEPVRDFISVRDVGAAAVAVLERGRRGRVYNCCSGEGRTVRELLDAIIAESGIRCEAKEDPSRLRAVELPTQIGDASRLAAETGWSRSVAWSGMIRDLWMDWKRRAVEPRAGA